MTMTHCTSEQFHQYIDGRLDREEEETVRHHLAVCPQCSAAVETLQRLDRSLRQLPREQVSAGFTERVLSELRITPASPLSFRLLEKTAYLFGLLIVLAIMLTAFMITGVFDEGALQDTQHSVQTFLSAMGEGVGSVGESFSVWLKTYIPFIYAKGTLNIALFGSLILGVLALLDRLLVRRFVHRV